MHSKPVNLWNTYHFTPLKVNKPKLGPTQLNCKINTKKCNAQNILLDFWSLVACIGQPARLQHDVRNVISVLVGQYDQRPEVFLGLKSSYINIEIYSVLDISSVIFTHSCSVGLYLICFLIRTML